MFHRIPACAVAAVAALCAALAPTAHALEPLAFSTYMTSRSVEDFLKNEDGPESGVQLLQELGVTKVYLEVYRSGHIVPPETLAEVRDYLENKGFAVAGGIATTPGGDVGVRQEGPLGWFNWQNPKTQEDLRTIIRESAPVFDEFIVDDFFCTGDISAESDAARAGRPWSDYRRDLLVRLANEVFLDPAKAANPDITMIIKYPQWYDLFHVFGYDVPRTAALFDEVRVGTETRGARTQRYGFVQPYEGFVNYRWIASIAGAKQQGAWFDHGDTDGDDFVEQAFQSTLAGAPELILFNYANLREQHPGHALLIAARDHLERLSEAVRQRPVTGIVGYKPPNSDAGSDLYILDFVGMLGIPLVPQATFPEDAKAIFLPSQAAADPRAAQKAREAVEAGATVIVTTGFAAAQDAAFAEWAGLAAPPELAPIRAESVRWQGNAVPVAHGLDLAGPMRPAEAVTVAEAVADGQPLPVLTRMQRGQGTVCVWNVRTFSQADFDAVGEVLLAPRALGLLEVPQPWLDAFREPFLEPLGLALEAPVRVCLQPMDGGRDWVIHNYNTEPVTARLGTDGGFPGAITEALDNRPVTTTAGHAAVEIPARSRVWLQAK